MMCVMQFPLRTATSIQNFAIVVPQYLRNPTAASGTQGRNVFQLQVIILDGLLLYIPAYTL